MAALKSGATSDQLTVIVKRISPHNTAPTVDAGPDQTIALPAFVVLLVATRRMVALRRFGARVRHRELEAGACEVAGHRCAHLAKADEADAFGGRERVWHRFRSAAIEIPRYAAASRAL